MPLRETIRLINEMQGHGVISEYAIGGAVGAAFYLEPASTLDVDIFVIFPEQVGRMLVSLSPIYEYAAIKKWKLEAEAIVIGDWPVQFLAASDALEREALAKARAINIDDVPTRVIDPEHLAALAIRTGRAKDYSRVLQLLDAGAINQRVLDQIIAKNDLTLKWQNFRKRFMQ